MCGDRTDLGRRGEDEYSCSLLATCVCCADSGRRGEDEYMLAPIKLLVLAPGQEIALRAVARKGVGKDHAKFSPVATVAVSRMPTIRVNDALMATLTDEQRAEFVARDPNKVFELSPTDGRVRLSAARASAVPRPQTSKRSGGARGVPPRSSSGDASFQCQSRS